MIVEGISKLFCILGVKEPTHWWLNLKNILYTLSRPLTREPFGLEVWISRRLNQKRNTSRKKSKNLHITISHILFPSQRCVQPFYSWVYYFNQTGTYLWEGGSIYFIEPDHDNNLTECSTISQFDHRFFNLKDFLK